MNLFFNVSNHVIFWYYVGSNISYLVMLIVALKTSAAHQRRLTSHNLNWIKESPMVPSVTIIAPAHNEEASIRVAVHNLLELDYPELEVVIVNDGSDDRTLEEMRDEFHLRPVRGVYVPVVPSAKVRGLYRSTLDSRLLVVDKRNGGNKADAVNAGLNVATSTYVCIVDADSVLERDALLRIMVPILADPDRVIAVGGIIRVLNGSEISGGQIRRVRLPRKSIEVIQVIEYLRAFLIGREAWAQGNMLTVISGAFGLFRTDLVRAVGGYRCHAIGEDFDLVARLHRLMLKQGVKYEIKFVPDPMCWTEAPSDLKSLGRQRARWQSGLMDVLWSTRDMLFRPRYGRIGFFALPYLWIFEMFSPVIEIVGLATIIATAILGILSRQFFLQFLLFGYAFATMISIGSVLQEELTYKRYNDWQDVVRLVTYCFVEHFPYRQMHMIWRLQGTWRFIRGDHEWKPLKRKGMQSADAL
jgi:cellulose synthase/poly-beta-1,6-N-acetylglucosamine synthase-like glycosyltransferase